MGTTTLTRSLLTDVSLFGIITDALGTAVTNVGTYDDNEVGKGVILAAASYVAAGLGDEVEGIVNSVETGTVNTGFSWGGIQTKGRANAIVGAAQTGNVAIGALVCNDVAIANGTAGQIQVLSVGTGFVTPTQFLWRVIRIVSGTGAAGDSIIIERV